MQKILTMTTYHDSLRAAAQSWGCEDADVVVSNKDIGLSGGPKSFYCYDCPLRAMADGWRLMAPPKTAMFGEKELFEWWFEK